jgi:3-oxoacyl-[acyl-carrier-protein] synthase II
MGVLVSNAHPPRALITGVGLVSSVGDGADEHWSRLGEGAAVHPVVDDRLAAPYALHTIGEIAYETQIPGRGDRRQMGPWQLLGTYAAGQALSDAGLAGDAEAKSRMNLLVAAGTAERDPESDTAVLGHVRSLPADGPALNRQMMDTLRPTLFLAQLANLLAGNISIVHKVTRSSCTFMGAEMAGVSVVENAVARIRSGADQLFLVGGAFIAAADENLCVLAGLGRAWKGPWRSVWQRAGEGGGAITGSVGAFLVIESAEHAARRGAPCYGEIERIVSGRDAPGSEACPIRRITGQLTPGPLLVLSGASGIEPQTGAERKSLEELGSRAFAPVVRGFANVLGLAEEAHFPAGLALAAIAARRRAAYDPFDDSGFEEPAQAAPERILVTTCGQWRGAGAGLVVPAG